MASQEIAGSAPYARGDRIRIRFDPGEVVEATVSTVIPTDSLEPTRRWRILYRVDAETTWDLPVHCGDDGTGEHVERVDDAPSSRTA